MNEEHIREVQGFINLHGKRIVNEPIQRVAYLAKFSENGMSLACEINAYTLEYIVNNFNVESPLVRWIIKQIQTHDMYNGEQVLGLIFDKNTIHSEVIKMKRI